MERAMARTTSSRNSGGVIKWTVDRLIVLEFSGYPSGSILSNLVLKTEPARDCVLNREKRINVTVKKRPH